MKKMNRILLCLLCLLLLAASWFLVSTAKTDEEIQAELIAEAKVLLEDEIYIRAQPLLEEAVTYPEKGREEAEQLLKSVYCALIDEVGYRNLLKALYETQISRENAPVYQYLEASDYFMSIKETWDAIRALRIGWERTADETLCKRYEEIRYSFTYGGETYQDVTAIHDDMIQVQRLDLWGLANLYGELVVPCRYEKISSVSEGQAVVKLENEIFTIDMEDHRLYLLKNHADDFSNYSEQFLALTINGCWRRATGSFLIGSTEFEELGLYQEGHAAAKVDGKWGVIDQDANWVIEPQFDAVIMDELGRCWAQGAVFVREGGQIRLIVDGEMSEAHYEDAFPFRPEGWAAVKKDGKWVFIDTNGEIHLACPYEEARSFDGHLAAVQIDGHWGFISTYGKVAIDPVYQAAGDFSNGAAPVKTQDGWQFIILDEYRES